MTISRQFDSAAQASQYIRQLVNNDSAGKYNCGQGVRFTLQSLNIPHLSRSETGPQHGYTWDDMLESPKMQQAGWEKVDWQNKGWTPESSPPGVLWVYPANDPPSNNGKGAQYGHVEIALFDGYASGGVFNNPGGSVRHNTPTAFMHPKLAALASGGNISEEQARDIVKNAQTLAAERRNESLPISPPSSVPIRVASVVGEQEKFMEKKAVINEGKPGKSSSDTVLLSSLGDDFGGASYDIETMDFSNMDFGKLLNMIYSVFFGLDPRQPYPRQDFYERPEFSAPSAVEENVDMSTP